MMVIVNYPVKSEEKTNNYDVKRGKYGKNSQNLKKEKEQ